MKFITFISPLLRICIAILLAVFATAVIGIQLGTPQDIDSVERNIRAIEQASYKDGRAVSYEERDKALTDAGHTFHLPSSSTSPPQSTHQSTLRVLEGAIRWRPWLFSASLLVLLLILRPAKYAGFVMAIVLAPVALILSTAVSIAVAAAGLVYSMIEIVRRRAGTSESALKP